MLAAGREGGKKENNEEHSREERRLGWPVVAIHKRGCFDALGWHKARQLLIYRSELGPNTASGNYSTAHQRAEGGEGALHRQRHDHGSSRISKSSENKKVFESER